MRHKTLMFAVLMSLLIAVPASVADAKVTDEDVRRAIEKAKEYLLSQQNEDGSWDETSAGNHDRGITALTMCTLTYIGMHPNRPSISKGIQHLIAKPITAVYPLSLKIMTLSYVQNKLIGQKRQIVRKALVSEAQSLYKGQRAGGGWHYGVPSGSFDFSCTQLAVLGLREAALAGVEIPAETFREVQGKYYKEQCDDGGWTYTVKAAKGAAAMTYAGLASIYITSDNLMLGMGCPYLDAKARQIENVNVSHMDPALRWVQKNFSGGGGYAGYALERVGVTSGYKYLGKHDWYKEIAESLVKSQLADGSWGGIINTCFNTMFLYKGRAPVLFNKLQFKGKWRIHRRDISNLTKYIIRRKEQPFHWQVVNLDAAVSDLHDAPVLYISTPHAIDLTKEGKRKLRAFTDTGGTILVEAIHGSARADSWFRKTAKEIWPEWELKALPANHGVFKEPHRLAAKRRPSLLGMNDGLRTFIFYADKDLSCAWNKRQYATKGSLFDLGINIYTYATDRRPLRAKLAGGGKKKARYNQPVNAGPQTALSIARIKHDGAWNAGARYRPFASLAKHLKDKAAVNLSVASEPVVLGDSALDEYSALYLAGHDRFEMGESQIGALKKYLAGGGFLFAEATVGSLDFDIGFRAVMKQAGLRLEQLEAGHKMKIGTMGPALGYNVASGVRFRKTLRVKRLARAWAELWGIYSGNRLVGVYSPFDIMFCLTGYDAYNCNGYETEDAMAIGSNIFLYLTVHCKGAQPGGATETAQADSTDKK